MNKLRAQLIRTCIAGLMYGEKGKTTDDYCSVLGKLADEMEKSDGWVQTSDRRPDAGRLIVKRWKNGSVWAGVYSGTDKDSSFDEWCYLPNN